MGKPLHHVFCIICCAFASAGSAQGLNNLWMGGYESAGGLPWGGTDIDFSTDSPVTTYHYRNIGFGSSCTNITDEQGALLFSTNGTIVANAAGDTMVNGAGLNPGWYAEMMYQQYAGQSVLILPKPDMPGIHYLIHGTFDDPVDIVASYLYLSIIDMGLDGGAGAVVSKNQILLEDALNIGKISAVRHANGRDWWIFCHKANTNTFYRLLLTPEGITVDGTQAIGVVRPPDMGQVCFSPDGSKFAYYWCETKLEVFDFDRCSGLFSSPIFATVQDTVGTGVALSPNGRFVYVATIDDVYQFDTEAPDFQASMVHIATWDGFYSPEPPLATMFEYMQLAPDGKIYISTGNSTFHLHVIHEPDLPGLACNLEQHGLELPTYYSSSLPNHPNYHLGALVGSPCDTLGLTVGVQVASLISSIRAFPNPSDGHFTLNYPAQPMAGRLEVMDAQGRVVSQGHLPAWSQVHTVVLENVDAGMYQCRARWGDQVAVVRVVIHTP